jgi:hypothetical protein
MEVTIPPTTKARVFVPAADPSAVTSPANVRRGTAEKSAAVFEATPGTYTFTSTVP